MIVEKSRKIFYFALKGKNFDGEKFVEIALKKELLYASSQKNLDQKIKICNLLKVIM